MRDTFAMPFFAIFILNNKNSKKYIANFFRKLFLKTCKIIKAYQLNLSFPEPCWGNVTLGSETWSFLSPCPLHCVWVWCWISSFSKVCPQPENIFACCLVSCCVDALYRNLVGLEHQKQLIAMPNSQLGSKQV